MFGQDSTSTGDYLGAKYLELKKTLIILLFLKSQQLVIIKTILADRALLAITTWDR